MSKSLKRVRAALEAAGQTPEIREVGQARTAQEAADSVGCEIDQIAKSIIFRSETDGRAVLFVTAGGNQVDPALATTVAGTKLARADAAFVRAQTGFAIGGVSPVAHLSPPLCYFDPRLQEFAVIYAAAGTPRHLFGIAPDVLRDLCGGQVASFICT